MCIRDRLNEEARGHYHDEIVTEVRKLNGYLPEGSPQLIVPHENFNRAIGAFKRQKYTIEGTLFEGSDEEWDAYLQASLPSDEDEALLKELFKQEWVANKPMSARQIASGIGANA